MLNNNYKKKDQERIALRKIFTKSIWFLDNRTAVDSSSSPANFTSWLANIECFKKVYRFESNVKQSEKLKKNLKLFEHVSVLQLKCSHSFLEDSKTPSMTLDDFFYGSYVGTDGPQFIHLGSRPFQVLTGAKKCLLRCRPLLFLEVSKDKLEVQKILVDLEYRFFDPYHNTWQSEMSCNSSKRIIVYPVEREAELKRIMHA